MAFTRTYDGDEPVRVNKWLGQTGVCSRREADSLIANGLVSIDGETIGDAGRKIQPVSYTHLTLPTILLV